MIIQIGLEVWVDDGTPKIGVIKEVKSGYVVLETIHGQKIVTLREKVKPIRELYHV